MFRDQRGGDANFSSGSAPSHLNDLEGIERYLHQNCALSYVDMRGRMVFYKDADRVSILGYDGWH